MLEKQQQPRWRLILSFIACCLLYAVSFGSDFSSGIPYSFLVLEPCGPNQSFAENQNESAEFQNQSRGDSASFATFPTPNTLVTATSQRNDSNVSESEIRCGGFGQGRSTTAWVASAYTSIRAGTTWTAGVFVEVFGARRAAIIGILLYSAGSLTSSFAGHLYVLFITNGVVAGVGAGLLFGIPIPVINMLFTNRKHILMSGSIACAGLGAIAFALVGEEAIKYGGWPWYYRMLSLFGLGSLLLSLSLPGSSNHVKARHQSIQSQDAFLMGNEESGTLKPNGGVPDTEGAETEVEDDIASLTTGQKLCLFFRTVGASLQRGFSLYKNRNFRLLVVFIVSLSIAYFYPIVTVRDRARSLSETGTVDISTQVIVIGCVFVVGAVLAGVANQYLKFPAMLTQGLLVISMGVTSVFSIFVRSNTGLLCFIGAYSCLASSVPSLLGPVVLQIVQEDQKAHAFGQTIIASSITLAVGPPLFGLLLEVSGSYTLPVLLAGSIQCFAGGLETFLHFWIKRREARTEVVERGAVNRVPNAFENEEGEEYPHSPLADSRLY